MLYADKAALENRTKVKLLSVRERELTLYTNNCRTVGTVSALMAGIAYSALIYTKMAYFQESNLFVQFLYICGLVACMCLSLRNVFGTTMLTMLGPGKALRGPDGSMHSAVDGMLDSFEGIVYVQHLSIYSFMATTMVYSWTAATMGVVPMIIMGALITTVTYTMIIRTRVVNKSFPLLSIPLVSGAFFPGTSASAEPSRGPGSPSNDAAAAAAATTAAGANPSKERIARWQQQQRQQQQQQQGLPSAQRLPPPQAQARPGRGGAAPPMI